MSNLIKNIVFDMGGVLIEWRPKYIASQFSSDPAVQALVEQEIFAHEDWRVWDRGGITVEGIINNAADRTGLPRAEVERLIVQVYDSLLPIEATVELMADLKACGYNIYCLSNMPLEHYHKLSQELDFWPMFDGKVISGLVEVSKPNPEIYRYLLEKYQLQPETCLFLDDFSINIEAAQKLGINALLFTDAAACRIQLVDILG